MKNSDKPTFDTTFPIRDSLSSESELNPHRGKVVEYVVRRHPMSLSDICRMLGISRRTLYNWFENEKLAHDVISHLGSVIDHDFTVEFPGEDYKLKMPGNEHFAGAHTPLKTDAPVHFWMNKYIDLLEKFNQNLLVKTENDTQKEVSKT